MAALTKLIVIFSLLSPACASRSRADLSGNEGGSNPINEAETVRYKKALLKCYKTGGNRIVKIEGRLRCY